MLHEINRWRRYGKDRLYVARADGTKVGWWDLQTDEGHPEEAAYAVELGEAVRRWQPDAASEQSTDALAAVVPVMTVVEVTPAPDRWKLQQKSRPPSQLSTLRLRNRSPSR